MIQSGSSVKYSPWLTLSGSGILLGVETTGRGGGDDTNQANNNANITDVLTYTLIISVFILTPTYMVNDVLDYSTYRGSLFLSKL